MFGSGTMFASQNVGGFGETQGAPSSTQMEAKKQRTEEKQTCLPVTLRAMERALSQRGDGGDIKFWGTEQTSLLVVASIEALAKQGTSLEMTLNDGTGRMKARYFFTEANSSEVDKFAVGRYVSAFGNVRSAPVAHFAMHGARLVESADEVSYHMIESAHSALRLMTGATAAPTEATTPALKRTSMGGTAATSPEKIKMDQDPAPSAGEPTLPMTSQAVPEAAKPAAAAPAATALSGAELRAAVLKTLQDASDNPEGLNYNVVAAKLAPAALDEVRKHLQSLVDDGDVFTTVDDDHFSAL